MPSNPDSQEELPTTASWFELSLAGDIDGAARAQSAASHRATDSVRQPLKSSFIEDGLPVVRIPAPPCPGFERLDAIMSIELDKEETNLASYKPQWSGGWAEAMSTLNSEEFSD